MARIGIMNLVRSAGSGAPPGDPDLQLLEDFTLSPRNNSEGDMLFDAYTGEDPGSSAAVVSNSLRLTGSAVDQSIYMDFLPIVASTWYPFPQGYAQNYLRSGTWDPDNTRLGFLVRSNTATTYRTDGGDIIQVGTYIKNHGHADDHEQGRHFYHYFDVAMVPNVWMAFVLDEHPQHERENPGNYAVNPALYVNPTTGTDMSNDGFVSYMDGLSRFYFDPQPDLLNSIWDFDDFYFWKRTGEPDYYISSLAYCYDGTRYVVYWSSLRDTVYTHEVRYRTDGVGMRSAGFTSGTSGGTISNNPGNDYVGARWQGPSASESTLGIYVAIRVVGQTYFRQVFIPYQMAPGNHGFAQ
jgi:hypothetical protein